MPADARISAWMHAWSTLESATQLLKDHINVPAAQKLHGHLVNRADVYTRLACAPEDVGLAVGEVLQEQHTQELRKNDPVLNALLEHKERRGG